jgi:hypothetical protein
MIRVTVEVNDLLDAQIVLDLLKNQGLEGQLEFRNNGSWYRVSIEPTDEPAKKRRNKKAAAAEITRTYLTPDQGQKIKDELEKRGFDPENSRSQKSRAVRAKIMDKYGVSMSTINKIAKDQWRPRWSAE